MKLAGFLLLLAGWILVLSALALLPSATARSIFAMVGFAVELLGLVLAIQAHLPLHREDRN